MNTQISSKLAAMAFALLINGMMIGGVAYLFSTEAQASELDHSARSAAHGTAALADARVPSRLSSVRA